VVKPTLAIVDGIIGMEGLGPIDGDPLEMDLIIAGDDPVAVDAVTSAVMGFESLEYGCVYAAAKSGIGIADLEKIQVVGRPIAEVRRRFKRAAEAMEAMTFPEGFKLLMDEKTCSGCRNTTMKVLLAAKAQNQLDGLAGFTMVAGKVNKLPEIDRERLMLIGACTAKYENAQLFVQGCPPNIRDIRIGLGAIGIDVVVGLVDIDSFDASVET
jgi:hypothetical protein